LIITRIGADEANTETEARNNKSAVQAAVRTVRIMVQPLVQEQPLPSRLLVEETPV
jgi:hypothetical protein